MHNQNQHCCLVHLNVGLETLKTLAPHECDVAKGLKTHLIGLNKI